MPREAATPPGTRTAKVEIYFSPFCPYCIAARRLLERKGIPFEVIDVLEEPGRRREMIQRARGRTTVPQVFIDGRHVGGSDELHALDRAGKIDRLLFPED